MQNGARSLPGFLCATISVAFLVACGNSAEETTPGRHSWPDGYVVPLSGATFPLAAMHLPGATREYRSGPLRGFEFLNGYSGRPLSREEPVVAVADGEVIRIDRAYDASDKEQLAFYAGLSDSRGFVGDYALDKLRGRQVWVRHESGHISRYAHLYEVHPELEPGATVAQGQPIGLIGNTGIPSTGNQPNPLPRLHFELWSPDGSRYLGKDLNSFEIHKAVASVFSDEALPRFARQAIENVEAGGEVPEAYPPENFADLEFQVDPPGALSAGSAFAIPVTWDDPGLRVQDFFASLDDRPLGLIDAGNGAWILGAVPLESTGDDLILRVGAGDAFGRTISGQSALPVTGPFAAIEPREVEPSVLERNNEHNRQIESTLLGPVHIQALKLREAQWSAPFQPPTTGNVVAMFGQPAVHGVRRPENPLPGIQIEPDGDNGEISGANAGTVALVDELPVRGRTVALVHGGGVVTIYSGLGEVRVSVGDRVARGQILAVVQSGSPDARPVQVEIHVAGVPSNPVGWLDNMLPAVGGDSAN